MQGLVTDSSGAVVAGAKVIATNMGTGVAQSVVTNETGNYTFTLVPVGDYEMRVELSGFKTDTFRGLRVETAPQVRQDFTLQVGNAGPPWTLAAGLLRTTTGPGARPSSWEAADDPYGTSLRGETRAN